MKLNKLSLKDKPLFDKYLSLSWHELSVFSFENIYIWKGLFEISWVILRESLCVFFRDKLGCFMYLPALARKDDPGVLDAAFGIMDSFNRHKHISRIENIEEAQLRFYLRQGLSCRQKDPEYLCLRSRLADLSGGKFKSKRAPCNYFIKHYAYRIEELAAKNKPACCGLYNQWMRQRKGSNNDTVYCGMMQDSRKALGNALGAYSKLNFQGIVVKVNGKVKGFSFGYRLSNDTFCILYEITDLSIKGLAQFIFREFCRKLAGFKYINIMDDSGLENLKKVKLSYHPVKSIPAYIARRIE